MSEIPVVSLLGWIFAPLFSGLVGYMLAMLNGMRKRSRTHDGAMEQGMRALLRQQLINYHAEYVASGACCPVAIKEQATSVYNAYHALGGNGTGTQLYEEIMEQHVKEDLHG